MTGDSSERVDEGLVRMLKERNAVALMRAIKALEALARHKERADGGVASRHSCESEQVHNASDVVKTDGADGDALVFKLGMPGDCATRDGDCGPKFRVKKSLLALAAVVAALCIKEGHLDGLGPLAASRLGHVANLGQILGKHAGEVGGNIGSCAKRFGKVASRGRDRLACAFMPKVSQNGRNDENSVQRGGAGVNSTPA